MLAGLSLEEVLKKLPDWSTGDIGKLEMERGLDLFPAITRPLNRGPVLTAEGYPMWAPDDDRALVWDLRESQDVYRGLTVLLLMEGICGLRHWTLYHGSKLSKNGVVRFRFFDPNAGVRNKTPQWFIDAQMKPIWALPLLYRDNSANVADTSSVPVKKEGSPV